MNGRNVFDFLPQIKVLQFNNYVPYEAVKHGILYRCEKSIHRTKYEF